MTDLIQSLQTGSGSAWLFFPTAILLGILHGLEPGHSKTMMAAFIIAIRGTAWQAALLGASAALSHSMVIWGLAAAALYFGGGLKAENTEPYFQLLSAAIILAFAAWMFLRTRRDLQLAANHHHEHSHCQCHGHHDHENAHAHPHEHEPPEFQDAHERAHARDIEHRFAGRPVTTGQIAIFGLTGGLMPCPAALTVLLICLQLKQFTLGFALVWAFGIGLALTLVAAGVLAAWSLRKAQSRFGGLDGLFRRAPYVSCVLLLAIALYTGWHGWNGLP